MFEFRPHHFLCTLGFEGKGYSDAFVEGFAKIADQLRAPDGSGDSLQIRVTAATDSICAPCPNRRDKACTTEDKIQKLDQGHAAVLGIRAGQVLTWGEAKKTVAARMSDDDFERVCAPCAWRSLGVCKSALQRLRKAEAKIEVERNAVKASPKKLALTFSALAVLAVTLAQAPRAEAALVRENDENASRQKPLALVRSDLVRKHKSKSARALKKAWEALQAKKYPQAISLASPITNDVIFGDYGNWIVATAQYGTAQRELAAKRYPQAIKAAEASIAASFKIETKYPYSPMLKGLNREIGLAEIVQGDANAYQKKWRLAELYFEHGFQRLTTGNSMGLVRPESLRNYATSCKTAKSWMCDAWIMRFAFFYPRNSEEMRTIVQVIPDASNRPRPAFSGKLTQSYKAPDLDQTAFEQNISLYFDKKFGNAIRGFQQFVDEFPKSPFRFRARYWLAQAMTQEQQHDKAQQSYETLQHDSPLTYYGLLAAFAAGHDMNAPIDAAMPMVLERDPLLQASEQLRVQRAEQFIAEGAYELGAMELKEFRSRDALSSPFLMYLAALATEARMYNTAFGILSDLIARNYEGATTAEFLSMVFPLAHVDEIKKQAAIIDIDPILVLSLIKQESAFDKSAISSVGALGLMQLMPATASDTDPKVNRADLVEAPTNIRVGTMYLKKLLTHFNGNIVLALAGYNAGPGAADRWFRDQGNKRGMLDFIETIPYKETREYVAAIVRNYYWYSRKLTPNEPAKALSFFWNAYNPGGGPAFVPAPGSGADSAPTTQPAATPAPGDDSPPPRAPVPLLPVEE